MASKFNFSLDQGVDNNLEITYAPSNVLFDLTGWVVTLQLRRDYADQTVDLELSTTAGSINVSTSLLLLNFSASATLPLEGKYVYAMHAVNGSAKRKICEGTVQIDLAVVRP